MHGWVSIVIMAVCTVMFLGSMGILVYSAWMLRPTGAKRDGDRRDNR